MQNAFALYLASDQYCIVVDSLNRSEDANSDNGDSDVERDDDVMDRAGNHSKRVYSATDVTANDTPSATDNFNYSFKDVGETEGENAQP